MTMTMFQAQLNTMVNWFDGWNESGQTVALFKMLTRLAPVQARFVSIALEHSLNECAELALREQEANNPGFVSSLLVEKKEVGMEQTLVHLPLLRPGNSEAKCIYLTLVPALLSYCLESGQLLEEARQLLSYVLIHPALREDRRVFEPWKRSFGEKLMPSSKAPWEMAGGEQSNRIKIFQQHSFAPYSTRNTIFWINVTSYGAAYECYRMGLSNESLQKTRRSNSLTPPFAVTPNVEWSSQDDLSMGGGRSRQGRRFSLSSEGLGGGPPLSPQSSAASSGSGGSESQLDLASYRSPEMRDMKNWLKSLRLHKYWKLFSNLSYEQILSISEENFDSFLEPSLPVTQGARRKIILSIAKLRDRLNILAALERDVLSGGHLLTVMDELKQILSTPIKAYPAAPPPPTALDQDEHLPALPPPAFDDIPTAFTRVLGKVCSQVMTAGRWLDEEAPSAFLSLLAAALGHEAFTPGQKKKISTWRLQISQHLLTQPMENSCPGLTSSSAGGVFTLGLGSSGGGSQRPSHQHLRAYSSGLIRQPSSPCEPLHQRHSVSVPLKGVGKPDSASSETEIDSRLESLCLSMTEHALGGSSEI